MIWISKVKSIFTIMLLSLCFSFCFVSSSYALDDISVSKGRNDTQWSQGDNLFPTCTDNACLSQYKYLVVNNTSPVIAYSGQTVLKFNSNAVQNYITTRGYAVYDLSLLASPITEITFVNPLNVSFVLSTETDTITFTLTNSISEECQDNPTNSLDSLDDLVKAIYSVSATLIMIYVFFCIYQIIIGGTNK